MANAPLGTVVCRLRSMAAVRAEHDVSDRDLLLRFLASREEAAFAALLRRHGPMVLHVCRRIHGNEHDAEDVFQATFLLLVRKADSIRKQESVASWLYGVAHRLARQAKGQGIKRQARERRAADMHKIPGIPDRAWQQLQATLHEALEQLPERFRAPLLLCYLQGHTHEEAARHLGCPLGTVRSRLARGRERLKESLHRRGIRLSAVALAAALAGSETAAAVPPALLRATARVAGQYAAGEAARTLVSTRTAAILEDGLKAMMSGKFKFATAVFLTAGALTLGTAAILPCVPIRPPEPVIASEPPAAGAVKQVSAPLEKKDRDTVRGRVLDPDGRPLAGARLVLSDNYDRLVDMGRSEADGRFTIAVPRDRKGLYLFAQADGAGLDFLSLERLHSSGGLEFRLVKDQPIRGRVLNTEGRPVAGVRVTLQSINVYADHSADLFLLAWKRRHFMSGIPTGVKHFWSETPAIRSTTTDADGRFTLDGLGAERVVSLRLHGGRVADTEMWVVNRAGFDPKPYNQASQENIPKGFEHASNTWLLYGPNPTVVAEGEKPIRGMVTASDTGRPRSGVEVLLTSNGKDLAAPIVKAKTDARGRFEIHGARKANDYMLELLPDPAAGYLGCQVHAADTPGYQPVTADIRVARGVVITGRVLDRATGKPLPGFVMADVLAGNPYVKNYPKVDSSAWIRTERTADDGTFRLVTIPGPVLLMGGPDYRRLPGGLLDEMKYKPPVPDPKYPQYFNRETDTTYYTIGGGISPIQGDFCKVLEIKPGTAVANADVLLERASALPVQIQDAAGRPLTGVWATGISAKYWTRPIRLETASCSAYGVEGGKPRVMAFYEPGRKLVGSLTLQGGEKGPVVARLGPSGGIRGRLLDADGKPLTGFVIELYYKDREAEEVNEYIHRASPQVVTDATGAFQMDELISGLKFTLYYYRSRRDAFTARKVSERTFTAGPGGRTDLGDLRTPAGRKSEGE